MHWAGTFPTTSDARSGGTRLRLRAFRAFRRLIAEPQGPEQSNPRLYPAKSLWSIQTSGYSACLLVHHANVDRVTKDVDSAVAINTVVTAPLGPCVRAADALAFANSGEGPWFVF